MNKIYQISLEKFSHNLKFQDLEKNYAPEPKEPWKKLFSLPNVLRTMNIEFQRESLYEFYLTDYKLETNDIIKYLLEENLATESELKTIVNKKFFIEVHGYFHFIPNTDIYNAQTKFINFFFKNQDCAFIILTHKQCFDLSRLDDAGKIKYFSEKF